MDSIILDKFGIKQEIFQPNRVDPKGAGDCFIRAICKVTSCTWEEIYKECAKEGLKQHRVMNSDKVLIKVYAKHGVVLKYKRLKTSEDDDSIEKFKGSVIGFMSSHMKGSFLITTKTHIFAFVDGVWYDAESNFKVTDQFIISPVEMVFVKDESNNRDTFEKFLKDKNIDLTVDEIADDCQGILDMLDNKEN